MPWFNPCLFIFKNNNPKTSGFAARAFYETVFFQQGDMDFYSPAAHALQVEIMHDGQPVYEVPAIQQSKAYYYDNLAHFDESERRIINPHYYKVDISDDLHNLKTSVLRNLTEEIEKL